MTRLTGTSWRAMVVCAALTMAAGCGADTPSPTSPSPSGPRSGTWVGILTETSGPSATFRLILDERPIDTSRSLLTATWSATYPDPARTDAGSGAGTLTDGVGTLLLSPATAPSCPGSAPAVGVGTYAASMLSVTSATIDGPYTLQLCAGAVTGRLTLTRQ